MSSKNKTNNSKNKSVLNDSLLINASSDKKTKKKTNPTNPSYVDNDVLNSFTVPNNDLLDAYSMQPIARNSLIIKNGVMYILGGISSGKSTLISKMMAMYKKYIDPIILYFYSGLSPDETTTFNMSNFGIQPHYIRLPTPESLVSFFDRFKYKRIKLAEIMNFLYTVYKRNTALILSTLEVIQELDLNHHVAFGQLEMPQVRDQGEANHIMNERKKFNILYQYVAGLSSRGLITIQSNNKKPNQVLYLSEYILKTYARKHKISFESDPISFISNTLISFAKGLRPQTVTIDILNDPATRNMRMSRHAIMNRFIPHTFPPFIRLVKSTPQFASKTKFELVPSISVFDDIASFPLFTTDRATQWVKDLLSETRRQQNTFIFSAQRYTLLNKTLRSLTHTFFIGYGLVDGDLPHIAEEIPSQLLDKKDFILLYKNSVKKFTFIVYNNKLGWNVLTLHR